MIGPSLRAIRSLLFASFLFTMACGGRVVVDIGGGQGAGTGPRRLHRSLRLSVGPLPLHDWHLHDGLQQRQALPRPGRDLWPRHNLRRLRDLKLLRLQRLHRGLRPCRGPVRRRRPLPDGPDLHLRVAHVRAAVRLRQRLRRVRELQLLRGIVLRLRRLRLVLHRAKVAAPLAPECARRSTRADAARACARENAPAGEPTGASSGGVVATRRAACAARGGHGGAARRPRRCACARRRWERRGGLRADAVRAAAVQRAELAAAARPPACRRGLGALWCSPSYARGTDRKRERPGEDDRLS